MTIGLPTHDVDWMGKTSGASRYTSDIGGDDLVHAALVRSPYTSARIIAIDMSHALALPGVLAVASSADLAPGTRYIHTGGASADREPLASRTVHYIGQEVAAVAAESLDLAREAADLVRVRYRPWNAPTDVSSAVRRAAASVRPDRDRSNVSVATERSWGDMDGARARAVHVARGRFHYPQVSHACMEPNTTQARWNPEEGYLEIWTSTQAPHFIQSEIAHVLGMDPERIICREVFAGGGFGSKSKISEHEVPCALLAMKLPHRPVLLRLSRREEFAYTKTRHAFETEIAAGADSAGKLHFLAADISVDNGAFNHTGPSVMGAGSSTVGEIYTPNAASYAAQLVYTAKQPGGQFRGYGTPQVVFAIESVIDELAEQVGIDPLRFRLMNAQTSGQVTLSGLRLQSARLIECLVAVEQALDWDERRDSLPDGHGLGVAVAIHGSGTYAYDDSNRSSARVAVGADGGVRVWFGGADPGTGMKTVIAQVAAEELRCDLEAVTVTLIDSAETPFDMGSWSSRGTYFAAHAVGKVARRLATELERAGEGPGDGAVASPNGGLPRPHRSREELGSLACRHPDAVDGMLIAEEEFVEARMERHGSDGLRNKSATYSFAAHGVEVSVDRTTGQWKILRYVAAHDIGRAMNPPAVESQIHGGVAMGLGAVMGEQVIYDQGRVANPTYIDYPVPRAPDLPSVEPILIEGPDEAGPYDAKGIGEIALVPCAPAVANAIHNAVGIRIRELPITPDKILTSVLGNRATSRQVNLWRRPSRWWTAMIRSLYPRGLHWILHRYGTRFGSMSTPSRIREIRQPETWQQTAEALDGGAVVIGGGTDLLPDGIRSRSESVSLVNLAKLPTFNGIQELESGDLRIGANATLAELEDEASVPSALADAATSIAGPQVRGAATVAGNLLQEKRCWFYRNDFNCYKRGGVTCPCYAVLGDHSKYHAAVGAHRCQAVTPSDLATCLVALEAQVLVYRSQSGSSTTVPVDQMYTGPGETVIGPRDLVEAVIIPARTRSRASVFEKMNRSSGDFAMVSVAVVAEAHGPDSLWSPTVVLGAVAPTPWRVVHGRDGEFASLNDVRDQIAKILIDTAHPLPGNAWKLDAALGLFERAAGRLLS